jgi:DNA-binding transcriptional ArsR family regulator
VSSHRIFIQLVEHSGEALDRVFHALANPTRRDILQRVAERPQRVGDLAAPHAMSLAAVSKHIKVLERAALVRQRRVGRQRYCELNPAPLQEAGRVLAHLERFWHVQLDALTDMLANNTDKEALT